MCRIGRNDYSGIFVFFLLVGFGTTFLSCGSHKRGEAPTTPRATGEEQDVPSADNYCEGFLDVSIADCIGRNQCAWIEITNEEKVRIVHDVVENLGNNTRFLESIRGSIEVLFNFLRMEAEDDEISQFLLREGEIVTQASVGPAGSTFEIKLWSWDGQLSTIADMERSSRGKDTYYFVLQLRLGLWKNEKGDLLIQAYWDSNEGGGVQKVDGTWQWLPWYSPAGDPIYRCIFQKRNTKNESKWTVKCGQGGDEFSSGKDACEYMVGK